MMLLGAFCYAEAKEIIYESTNSEAVVYELKQNSFTLLSITTPTGFANVGPIFYKVHSLISEQVFNQIELKTCSQFSELVSLLYSKKITILRRFLSTI